MLSKLADKKHKQSKLEGILASLQEQSKSTIVNYDDFQEAKHLGKFKNRGRFDKKDTPKEKEVEVEESEQSEKESVKEESVEEKEIPEEVNENLPK